MSEQNYTGDPYGGSERDALLNDTQQPTTPPDMVEPPQTPAPPSPDKHADSEENPNRTRKNAATSARKLAANRANAKKSTGPRSGLGKSSSRFNAVRHGLLARRLFSARPEMLDGLRPLADALREKYGNGDVCTELLLEATLTDYWRHATGLEYELKYLSPKECGFHPQGGMPPLQRYVTANRNALLKDLQLLEQRQPRPADVAGAKITDDTDSGAPPAKTDDQEESEAA